MQAASRGCFLGSPAPPRGRRSQGQRFLYLIGVLLGMLLRHRVVHELTPVYAPRCPLALTFFRADSQPKEALVFPKFVTTACSFALLATTSAWAQEPASGAPVESAGFDGGWLRSGAGCDCTGRKLGIPISLWRPGSPELSGASMTLPLSP